MNAPANESRDDEKDDFYDQLQATFDTCKRHDIVIVMGDLNAKVGGDNKDMEGIMENMDWVTQTIMMNDYVTSAQ